MNPKEKIIITRHFYKRWLERVNPKKPSRETVRKCVRKALWDGYERVGSNLYYTYFNGYQIVLTKNFYGWWAAKTVIPVGQKKVMP